MRARGTIALVLLFALGVCASPASADPLSMTFTEARANVGVQLSDAALFEAPDTAPLEAQFEPGTGEIQAGILEVPQFFTHITEPIVADVTVDFEIGEIEGSFTEATGALSLEGEAGGTLTAHGGTYDGEECLVSTIPSPLVLTTAGNSGGTSPRSGAPFAKGLAGPGAIAGQWTHMDATPVDSGDPDNVSFCTNVEGRIGGAGGVWMEQKGIAPSPPQPPSTDPPLPPQPPLHACVVPKVLGMRLLAAKKKIKAAGCAVGKVHMLKLKAKGRPFVVKSSNPAAGAKPANGKVHLRLGPKPSRGPVRK